MNDCHKFKYEKYNKINFEKKEEKYLDTLMPVELHTSSNKMKLFFFFGIQLAQIQSLMTLTVYNIYPLIGGKCCSF